MKRQNDIDNRIDALFGAARGVRIEDGGFTRKVAGQLVVPPSKNGYRLATLAVGLASLVIVAVVVQFDLAPLTREARAETRKGLDRVEHAVTRSFSELAERIK